MLESFRNKCLLYLQLLQTPTRIFLIVSAKLEMIKTHNLCFKEASGSSSFSLSNRFSKRILYFYSSCSVTSTRRSTDYAESLNVSVTGFGEGVHRCFGNLFLSRALPLVVQNGVEKGFWELSLGDLRNSGPAVHGHHCPSLEINIE